MTDPRPWTIWDLENMVPKGNHEMRIGRWTGSRINLQSLPRERTAYGTRLREHVLSLIADAHREGFDTWAMCTYPPAPKEPNLAVRAAVRKALKLTP
jgi:hypothetical protein